MAKDFDDMVCNWIDDYGNQINFVMEKLYNVRSADDITAELVESVIYDCLFTGLHELFGRAIQLSDMGDFKDVIEEVRE